MWFGTKCERRSFGALWHRIYHNTVLTLRYSNDPVGTVNIYIWTGVQLLMYMNTGTGQD